MPMQVTLGNLELVDVREVSVSVDRSPDAHGELGSAHHEISVIELKRVSDLARDNDVTTKLVELHAAQGENAYFSGSIMITSPDDENTAVRKIEWERGYICDLDWQIRGDSGTDSICIAVTKVVLNDSEFLRRRER